MTTESPYWNPRHETMPRDQLEALQVRKLRNLIEWASSQVPYHSKRLSDAGVTAGCGATTFCPVAPVTREQMAEKVTANARAAQRECGFPSRLSESRYLALTDGASRRQAFLYVVLPQVRNGILAIAVFTFIRGWEEYIFVFTFLASCSGIVTASGPTMKSSRSAG